MGGSVPALLRMDTRVPGAYLGIIVLTIIPSYTEHTLVNAADNTDLYRAYPGMFRCPYRAYRGKPWHFRVPTYQAYQAYPGIF